MPVTVPRAADDTTLQAAIADAQRLAAVRATALLDTPPEDCFDRLTRLATQVTGAPVAFLSLVDSHRDFYKSHCGFDEPLATRRTWQGRTFCHHSLLSDAPLVLDDVAAHAGFADIPTVRSLGIRAYAGIPLISDGGQRIGSFCVVDMAPRPWRALDVQVLTELAHAAMREIALRQALQRAEAASRAKSMFLSNMSHEIRTPMNAIIGLTHLVARDSRDPRQITRLGKVDTAARHLLQVINDILDIAKIEAGKTRLEDADFSLDELLTDCFDLVREPARAKGLELVLDTDHLPARLCGDATRLRQALLNLLSNAVKFTHQGWVRVRGELLRVDGSRRLVRFEVSDTGEGIAPDAQQQLFTAFEQADDSITRRHGGTGLGLALTRHLAQLMAGEVGLRSTLGQGSSFWFTAWLGEAASTPDTVAPTRLPPGLRALVVDDLAEASAGLANQLEQMGLAVHTAASGATALALVQADLQQGRCFDVMLIDWRMGPLDGIATARALRNLLQQAMPPCILVSAFDEPAMWQQARNAGFDTALVKPITPTALQHHLAQVLRHQAAAAPPPAAGLRQAETLLRQHHAGRRVLLADDNQVGQDVARELLLAVGLQVDVADDGARAVELACTQAYAAVLMDMQMPGMGGLDATRRIRARIGAHHGPQAGAQPPIIAMTAHAFGEDRASCLAAGMNDHIAKPVNAEHLYQTLLRWLPPV